jgi:hypothetical protein
VALIYRSGKGKTNFFLCACFAYFRECIYGGIPLKYISDRNINISSSSSSIISSGGKSIHTNTILALK